MSNIVLPSRAHSFARSAAVKRRTSEVRATTLPTVGSCTFTSNSSSSSRLRSQLYHRRRSCHRVIGQQRPRWHSAGRRLPVNCSSGPSSSSDGKKGAIEPTGVEKHQEAAVEEQTSSTKKQTDEEESPKPSSGRSFLRVAGAVGIATALSKVRVAAINRKQNRHQRAISLLRYRRPT